ncbi:hypothetical protein D3C80_1362720 [compost metagenome]
MQAGSSHIVDMQEFTHGGAGAPDHYLFSPGLLGLVEAANQCRNHVAVFRGVVVVWAVEVGWHHRAIVGAMLAIVRLAELDAGNLGHCIGFVGALQHAGQQGAFPHRLACQLGVDAGAAE